MSGTGQRPSAFCPEPLNWTPPIRSGIMSTAGSWRPCEGTMKRSPYRDGTSELQPLSPQAHYILGEAYYGARHYDKALEAFRGALDLDEMHGPAMMGAGIVYSQQFMFDEAISVLEWASTVHADNTTILASLGETYARSGQREKARHILNKLEEISSQHYVSPLDFALIAAGFGWKDKVIEYLERAYQESSPLLVKFLLPENPRFDFLRDDRRYNELIKRIREHSPSVA